MTRAVWQPPQAVKATGAVQSPGWIPFTQNMRVSDALMRAGGVEAGREPSALLLRKAPNHARVESALVIDLESALSGDEEADILLMPEDEIIVYGVRRNEVASAAGGAGCRSGSARWQIPNTGRHARLHAAVSGGGRHAERLSQARRPLSVSERL